MKRGSLPQQLSGFIETWVSNPAAKLDFVRLVESIHHQPTADHADYDLLEWIDEQRRQLKMIGIK